MNTTNQTAFATLTTTGERLGTYVGPATDRELAKWSIQLAKQFKVCVSQVVVTKAAR